MKVRICPECNKNNLSRKDAQRCIKCYVKSMKKENHPSWTGCRVCPRCNGVKTSKAKQCKKCIFETKYSALPTCIKCNKTLSDQKYRGCMCRGCRKGENHFAWNHELTEEIRRNHKIRLYDPKYYQWKRSVFKKNRFECQCCGENKQKKLVAHHIENYSSVIDKRFDIDNGITFCKKCHDLFHKIFGKRKNNMSQLIQFITSFKNPKQGRLFGHD